MTIGMDARWLCCSVSARMLTVRVDAVVCCDVAKRNAVDKNARDFKLLQVRKQNTAHAMQDRVRGSSCRHWILQVESVMRRQRRGVLMAACDEELATAAWSQRRTSLP